MNTSINGIVDAAPLSPIRKISDLVASFPDAVNLTVGQTDLPTPEIIQEAAIRAIPSCAGYTANMGTLELRRAYADFVGKRYGIHYDTDEVIVTNGATSALDIALRVILEPGDEIILSAPVYPGYLLPVAMCQATPVFVDTTNSHFVMTAELIEQHITPKTKCILLSYPSNPTGKVMKKDELEKIAAVMRKHPEIYILSDDIYSELSFTGEPHACIAVYPELKKQTIVVQSLSKSHSMAGWRIGFLLAEKELMVNMLKLQQIAAISASSVGQAAALEALRSCDDELERRIGVYVERRDYVYDRLVGMGLEVEKPEGAFYIFPSIRTLGGKPLSISSFDLAMRLAENQHLGVVPGSGFSEYGEGYIRISYAASMDTLKEGMDRLEKELKEIPKEIL